MAIAKKKKQNNGEPMDVDEEEDMSADENGAEAPVESDSEEELHMSEDEDGGCRIGGIYIPPPPKPALTFDCTGPRMIITHIVNENFKSYAGVQHLGPFHKSFTAIIGPNGSGKSNVIDSMLFVFGYRASKIRSKKVSVMIHSSAKFPNVQSCTVAVHFSKIIDGEGDDFTLVPNTELVVSRTAYKDNSSFYTLNGKKVHFKEVAKLLISHGIDLDHNRFLILQGEVEQIAMMKPKAQNEHDFGMLEYLEEIVGTSRYKAPLNSLGTKVESYTERRKEKLNRVRLVEAEKNKLEQPMKEAVELMNLLNQSIISRNLLLQKYIHETDKLRTETEASMAEKVLSVEEIDGKLNTLGKAIEEKRNIIAEGTKKYDALKTKKESLAERVRSCKKKTVEVQMENTQAKTKKKNLDQVLEQERKKLIEIELIPEKNTREIEDCAKLVEKHTENKRKADEELQTVLSGVRAQTKDLQNIKDELQNKYVGLRNIVDESNNSFTLAESSLALYLNTHTKETEKLNKMVETLDKAKSDLEEKKRIIKDLSSSLPKVDKDIAKTQAQLQDIKREETTLVQQIMSLRSELEQSRQKMSANRSRNRVLDSLMKEKQKGNIPGIFGRLGDLGGIELKYDVAISTCCGALDNIVVDSVETGQTCLNYLKDNDIGRATFIALDQQTHLIPHLQRKLTYPENVPRLFDLVKVNDERVLPAFYFALRETLVGKDLDQATRISYGSTRYRVVSLKGDVLEIAGTMSGGGKSVNRGRMASSVQQDTRDLDPALLQASERKLEGLEQRLNEIRTQQLTLEDSLSTLRRTLHDDRMTLDKSKLALASLTEQMPLLQADLKRQESKVAACRVDETRKQELVSKIESAREKLDVAKRNAGEVEKEIEGVDAQITAVCGSRVNDLQKKVKDLTTKVNKLNAEMKKLRVAIIQSERNSNLTKENITRIEADLAGTVKRLEEFGEVKKQLTLEMAEFQKQIEEIEEELSEGTDEFTGLKKEIAALQEDQGKLKAEKVDVQAEIGKHQRIVKECTNKTPVWEKEISQLKLEQIPADDSGIVIPGLEPVGPLQRHGAAELDALRVEELRARCDMHKQRLNGEQPNTQIVLDYRVKEALFLKRAAELDNVTTKRNRMRDSFDSLRKRRQNEFLTGFNTITTKLKEMYQMITLGGDAELELVDSLDPFTEGIIFSVRPPNKSWKNISNLSGGEKTLSSLALVFALHYYKPTPLYVMDEIDAALDFKNVSIVANYIKDRTKNAQFIIISLRYIMFETSNRLVGIYKTEDCTKSVTIDNVNDEILPEELLALL